MKNNYVVEITDANGKKVKKPASELQLPDYSTIRNEHASMKNIAFSVLILCK